MSSLGLTSPGSTLDTVLVCLDVQPTFMRVIQDGSRVLQRCQLAVASARGLGLPIVFTEQVPDKLGATEPSLLELAPGAPVAPKSTFSALSDGGAREAILGDSNIEHLLLCGIETPICVYQTAIAALGQGLAVTVLSDAVGARRPDDARVCLEGLARLGAHILPTETVFYALLHDASHPFFKEFTKRVKAAT
jgi:nicotinamidase-related amidase